MKSISGVILNECTSRIVIITLELPPRFTILAETSLIERETESLPGQTLHGT